MGIDQIGKKGPPLQPPAEEIAHSGRTAEAVHPFELSTPRTFIAGSHVAELEPARTALQRLRAGELDANGYLNLKVDEATTHLLNLPAGQLQSIRNFLRDRMASDPTLVELVRMATGRDPEPCDGDG